jgi:DNA-binding IclR family transcriptional regulator
MVRKEASTGRYRLRLKLWELGVASLFDSELRPAAAGPAEALRDEWGDTVHVAVYDEGDVVYVHKLDGTMPLRSYTAVGARAPAYCVATGKSLLAFQSEDERARMLACQRTAFTAATIIDDDEFRDELESVRESYTAVNRAEWRSDISGVGSPILDVNARAIGAIGIAGPVQRILDEGLDARLSSVRNAAAAVAAALAGPDDERMVDGLYATAAERARSRVATGASIR